MHIQIQTTPIARYYKRILSRGPPKHAPIAIRGKPCLAIVTLATASNIKNYKFKYF